ncbi:hypothetical protein EYF80_021727 [Liparis tanakae]|uniref:Uncharacterized protein n=1 Tax=Liparis tanakae TaxID=230148 RepID=A0A4Z2HT99_9TELE|nr:hypothetical protein EYF80_021727 [Liparis tanakae]
MDYRPAADKLDAEMTQSSVAPEYVTDNIHIARSETLVEEIHFQELRRSIKVYNMCSRAVRERLSERALEEVE